MFSFYYCFDILMRQLTENKILANMEGKPCRTHKPGSIYWPLKTLES